MKKLPILTTTLALGLTGCYGYQSSPESNPSYVSPAQYSDYNCKQLKAEMRRVSSNIEQQKISDTTGKILDTAITAFAISQGYGFTDDENVEYKRSQNQYRVLEQEIIRKECE